MEIISLLDFSSPGLLRKSLEKYKTDLSSHEKFQGKDFWNLVYENLGLYPIPSDHPSWVPFSFYLSPQKLFREFQIDDLKNVKFWTEYYFPEDKSRLFSLERQEEVLSFEGNTIITSENTLFILDEETNSLSLYNRKLEFQKFLIGDKRLFECDSALDADGIYIVSLNGYYYPLLISIEEARLGERINGLPGYYGYYDIQDEENYKLMTYNDNEISETSIAHAIYEGCYPAAPGLDLFYRSLPDDSKIIAPHDLSYTLEVPQFFISCGFIVSGKNLYDSYTGELLAKASSNIKHVALSQNRPGYYLYTD